MWLTPGMELLGVNKKSTLIVNGVRYAVESVNTRMVTVRMLPEFHCNIPELPPNATDAMRKSHTAKLQAVAKVQGPIPLMHRDASAWLRLTHCLCYATVQGITIRNQHLVMLDVLKGHFSLRTLIVAASRVTDGPYLHAATDKQQCAFLRRRWSCQSRSTSGRTVSRRSTMTRSDGIVQQSQRFFGRLTWSGDTLRRGG